MQVFSYEKHLSAREGTSVKKEPLQLALLGCGTVGGGVCDFVKARSDMEIRYVYSRRPRPDLDYRITNDIHEILNDSAVDVVIEAMGGLDPAYAFVKAALEAGKHVVTANKQLISAHYRELVELASRMDVALRCSASVGGGIPWLANLERTLEQEPIIRLSGIMNGTTNYILDSMHEKGKDFSEALREAQELGYAEADPSADLNGGDIRRKLVISANIAFGCVLKEEEVAVFGMETITDRDIDACKRMGRVCKMIASARDLPEGVAAYIEPAFLPGHMHEAAVPDNFNLISLTGLHIGKQSFYGQGAGRYPTAYNVVQDCVDIRNGLLGFYTHKLEDRSIDNRSVVRSYFVRCDSMDDWLRPRVAKVLDWGVLTKPLPVTEIHAWAKTRKDCFIASIR